MASGFRDTFFISHGSPTLCIDESLPARQFLQSFRDKLFPSTPKSILIISAHWETSEPSVNVVSGPSFDTIYDFYGFPESMYKLKYPAPGSPQLAERVTELLMASGFKQVHEVKRGLDHGAWVPLMLMYPDADIPVCQLSVQPNRDATYHYNMGRVLAPLKDEGVLIIGSGSATHNLRALKESPGNSVASWALEFDTWLKESLLNGRYDDVNHFKERAPHAQVAHPWPEHFYPLHVAIGAAGEKPTAELIHHSWSLGSLSYASYKFTSTV